MVAVLSRAEGMPCPDALGPFCVLSLPGCCHGEYVQRACRAYRAWSKGPKLVNPTQKMSRSQGVFRAGNSWHPAPSKCVTTRPRLGWLVIPTGGVSGGSPPASLLPVGVAAPTTWPHQVPSRPMCQRPWAGRTTTLPYMVLCSGPFSVSPRVLGTNVISPLLLA